VSASVERKEIEHFSRDAPRWWDESGPFAPLHRLNPVRLDYIKGQICGHFKRDVQSFTPFKGLSVLDIGCGGGLVCEPMARLGANVCGIDADDVAIEVAGEHAEVSGLEIDYQCTTAENILLAPSPHGGEGRGAASVEGEGGKKYDVVLALEIVEHVSNLEEFVKACAALVKPGGMIIFSTLNRTPKSFALGIVAAEYILRWVPRGTHSWQKFVKPSELARAARRSGLTPDDITGLIYNPVQSSFSLSKNDVDVNYFMRASK